MENTRKYRYIRGIASLLFGCAICLFWGLYYPHHLHYHEQFQLFLFTPEYGIDKCLHPGGIAEYIAEFLTQFYYFAWAGATILAIVLVLTIEISKTVNVSLHFADRNSVQLTVANTESKPAAARIICNCPKLMFGRLMIEYSIWNDVFKQCVPNATFKIRMCTVIPTRKVTMKSVNAAKILVTANRVRPCLVVRRILSPPVWYSPAKVGAAIATHRIARNKI